MEGGKGSEAEDIKKATASSALRHPIRIRILEIVNERDMSPIQFLHLGLAPTVERSQKTLSQISYHFRQLEEAGCLRLVEEIPRRGATEHVYRGTARAYFTDEEWEAMTPRERCLVSRTAFQGLAARSDSAMMAHTFDSRPDRHLTWIAMEVDERGWGELMAALAHSFSAAEQIRQDAKDRLAGSGEKVIPVTVGILGFESPPPPPLPEGDPEDLRP